MSKPFVDYYQLLEVEPHASVAAIRQSYQGLLAGLRDNDEGRRQAARLQQAMAILCDPQRRAAFDLELANKPGPPAANRRTLAQRAQYAAAVPAPDEALAARSPLAGWECEFCGHAAQSRSLTWAELDCPVCASPLEIPPRGDEHSQQSANERIVARYVRRAPLIIESDWPRLQQSSGHLLDLSTNGLRFECAQAFQASKVLRLDCALLRCVGRVAHSHASDPSTHVVGVEFRTLRFKRSTANFLDAKT